MTSKAIKDLLFEAYRRNEMRDSVEDSYPLRDRWLGLGTAAAYRPVIEAGLMKFILELTPPRGCMGWLTLTETGEALFHELEPELAERMTATAASWRGAVEIEQYSEDGDDHYRVSLRPWKGQGAKILIAEGIVGHKPSFVWNDPDLA
jgi:hypothetical protein